MSEQKVQSRNPETAGPQQRTWRTSVAALTVLVLLAIGGLVFTAARDDGRAAPSATPSASASPSATTSSTAGNEANVASGVFRQTDLPAVQEFETWAGFDVDYVVDFSARDTWEQIANPDYMLQEWKGSGLRPVYGIAMLPDSDDVSMRAGAQGDYDEYYVELAQNLVKADQADAILRVGWEFNLSNSRWGTDDPGEFIEYFRKIVTAMRTVSGQNFQFDWNLNNGDGNRYDAADYYPGDDVVDYVGVDAYDVSSKSGTYPYPDECDDMCRTQRQRRAWDNQIYGGGRGLRFWSAFAADHGKPLSLPEWGVWDRPDGTSGDDDPAYIQRMFDFINDPANNVAYQAYFEYDGDDGKAKHSLMSSFPQSGEVYRRLFAAS